MRCLDKDPGPSSSHTVFLHKSTEDSLHEIGYPEDKASSEMSRYQESLHEATKDLALEEWGSLEETEGRRKSF